jgi:glycine hydroxymethyltransferase
VRTRCVTIAELIATAVTKGDADPDHAVSREVRAQVSELVGRFPAYPRAGAAQA